MNHKAPKSVHRMDRKPAVPKVAQHPGVQSSGGSRPILEELRPAGPVHRVPKRPPGRPRHDGRPPGSVPKTASGPGPQPVPVETPPSVVPYVPIDVAILAGTLKGTFSFLSGVLAVALKVPATELEVTDKQSRELAGAWKPILDHYKVNLGVGALWANAIGTTFGVIGPKVQVVMSRRGLKLPSGPGAEEVKIVPPGVN